MDTEKSSKFSLPLLKEPQSKVTHKWLTQSSEFSMILKKTLKTVLPLKELLKTKDFTVFVVNITNRREVIQHLNPTESSED